MGSHQSAAAIKDEWLTPPEILKAFGPFDLDPCAPITRPWSMAARHYDINDDGLQQEWAGFVWLNPPYGSNTGKWLARMAEHGNGIALIFARTETDMFFRYVWEKADALLFLRGRLTFHHDGWRRPAAFKPAHRCLRGHQQQTGDQSMSDQKITVGMYVRVRDNCPVLRAFGITGKIGKIIKGPVCVNPLVSALTGAGADGHNIFVVDVLFRGKPCALCECNLEPVDTTKADGFDAFMDAAMQPVDISQEKPQ